MRIASHPSSPLFKLSLIALMMTSPTLLASNEALAQGWVLETADASANFVGSYTSLALDASGNPHVSYVDDTSGDLKYARKSGGSWTIEVADQLGYIVSSYTSLALDASGNAHVSYYDLTNTDLKYARKAGGVWTRESAEASANDVGEYSSLALDASGNPHIAYYDGTTDDLKYARKSGGVWTRETADGSANNVGVFASLVLDASANPHIAYLDLTTGFLKYARKSAGVWTRETADGTAGLATRYVSVAFDKPTGSIHVAYYDINLQTLKYAKRSGGLWTTELLDAVGVYNSLAVDAVGNPHVSNGAANNLKYWQKSGGTWIRETVDGSGNDVGDFSSLKLDSLGNGHISYYDVTDGNLKYAFIPGVRVSAPAGGVTWAVGSMQTISWSYTGGLGTDISDVFLSVDGGRTFDMVRDNTRDFSATIRVPHSPTRFAQIKIVQPSPFVVGYSDSFFTIDATITLAKFDATRDMVGDGTRLTWETRPGPEADIRYRVERATASAEFVSIVDGLDRGEYVDPAQSASSRYRLIAINGLGEEYVLGETSVSGALALGRDLSIQPNPARGGSTTFVFRAPFDAASGGASASQVEVAMFDLSGRKVATLADGQRFSGVHLTTWDGRDDAGRDVAAGVYFARLSWNGATRATERVTIVR